MVRRLLRRVIVWAIGFEPRPLVDDVSLVYRAKVIERKPQGYVN